MSLSRRFGILLALAAAPACNIYGDFLFDDENPSVGGSPSGGESSAGGGTTPSGGSGGAGVGGVLQSGGSPAGGGVGATPGTGAAPSTGGGTPAGGTAGTGAGGGDGGGGAGGSGGGESGGTGGEETGGMAGAGGMVVDPTCTKPPCLIDDFEGTPSANYANLPFYGSWSRYEESKDVWDPALGSVTAMMVADPDDAANTVLRVKASDLQVWGVGVFVTLKGGAATDISGFSAISFRAKTGNAETSFNVAIADEASHSPACNSVGSGQDCNKHMRTVLPPVVTSDWTTITLDLPYFIDKAVDTDPRVANLNLKKVYAIHFQMPLAVPSAAIDFYLDDITLE